MELFGPVTRETLLRADYIAQIFDYPSGIQRRSAMVQMRAKAKELRCTKEFDMLYTEILRTFNKANLTGNSDEQSLPLATDEKGQILSTTDNFATILREDPEYSDIRFNLLSNCPERGDVKWTDADDSLMRLDIEARYGIHNQAKLQDAFNVICKEREYHPVRRMIEAIEWDGTSRIYTLLSKWMQCEDTPYTREVSRLIFAGGIHRAYKPGCKFDDMPVLIGKQGEGKSTLVRWLAMDPSFFVEISDFEGQSGVEALEGKWIVEVGELLALTRTKEVEAIKAYITRQTDHYRKPYARYASDIPRQCVFLGTTNRTQFITDKTGGRRFYPITVHSNGYELFDHQQEIQHDIEQCWAEAKYLFDRELLEPFGNRALVDEFRARQELASEDDYRIGEIIAYLTIHNEVCIKQLWEEALGNDERILTRKDSNEITAIMENLGGWERSTNPKRMAPWGLQRFWYRVG